MRRVTFTIVADVAELPDSDHYDDLYEVRIKSLEDAYFDAYGATITSVTVHCNGDNYGAACGNYTWHKPHEFTTTDKTGA